MTSPVAGSGVSATHAGTAWPSARQGWYATILLTFAYTVSFIDRQVLNLLVTPIQADLGLTDTQISLLQGMAFVLTYVLMSVPLGRWVDRSSRVGILAVGVAAWSLATVACGAARGYLQLGLARMGVGAGEATVTPVAWSLLADYFPPDRLARPVSVFLMGPYLGAGLALILGAEVIEWTRGVEGVALPWVGEVRPWQLTFIIVGAPGLLLAAMLLTIREPVRRGTLQAVPTGAVPWSVVWQHAWRHRRVYFAFLVGVPFNVVLLYGLQSWVPTFLVRVHEWDLPLAGRAYGVVALVSGSAGVLAGPVAARWLESRGRADAPLRIAAWSAGLASLSAIAGVLQPDAWLSLALIGVASFWITFPFALITAALQRVTPNEMRGLVAGVYVVMVSVMGLGLGPTLVAVLTDSVFQDPAAVGKSLALMFAGVGPLAVLLLASGMSSYAATLREVESAQ